MQKQRQKDMHELLGSGDIDIIADSMTERAFSPGFREKKPDVFERYKKVKLKNSPEHYMTIMRLIGLNMADPPDLTCLKCPVLIIAGEHDGFMTKETLEYMKRKIPSATIRTLSTGHAAAVEDPEGFNRVVLEFLTP